MIETNRQNGHGGERQEHSLRLSVCLLCFGESRPRLRENKSVPATTDQNQRFPLAQKSEQRVRHSRSHSPLPQ